MMNRSRIGTQIESHTCTRIYPGETQKGEKTPTNNEMLAVINQHLYQKFFAALLHSKLYFAPFAIVYIS